MSGTPLRVNQCPCAGCKKGTGNATSLVLPLDALRFVTGTELVTTFETPGPTYVAHAFCRVCGSSVPRFDVAHGIAIVPIGSFEGEPAACVTSASAP
jgi:hypothetical protein